MRCTPVYAHEMHTYEMHTCEMHVYEVHAYRIGACEVYTYETHAHETHTHEMPMRHMPMSVTNTGPLGLGACLGSAALAQVVFFVASHTIFLSSFFRFDVLVY
jgi:hypothetical protein